MIDNKINISGVDFGSGRFLKNKSVTVPSIVAAIMTVTLVFMTSDERFVALPAFLCILGVLWLWMILWSRDNALPFFDVGVFCALATAIYSIYPLVNYWVDGLRFGILADARLIDYDISPRELGAFCFRHVLYLYSFIVAYTVFRRKETLETGSVGVPSGIASKSIIVYFLLFTGYFLVLKIFLGVDFNATYASEVYEKNLTAMLGMPLLLLQISEKLWGILFLFKLALLYLLIGRCRQRKWLFILIAWIVAEILYTFILKGSRTGLVLFLMSSALFYHRMLRPLSHLFLITTGSLVLLFFIFMGLYRSFTDMASMQTALSMANAGIFSGGNEFQALLGTAYDVLQMKKSGAYLPWYLYINDFILVLPPQQIFPFEKVPASEWYLRELGISGQGVGFMWGVISQSIVGLDWFELALRGGVLGYILAGIHRWYSRRQTGFLATLIYVYLCLKIYYTFRDTTFSILANIIWEIIPFILIIKITESVITRMNNAIDNRMYFDTNT